MSFSKKFMHVMPARADADVGAMITVETCWTTRASTLASGRRRNKLDDRIFERHSRYYKS